MSHLFVTFILGYKQNNYKLMVVLTYNNYRHTLTTLPFGLNLKLLNPIRNIFERFFICDIIKY